VSGKTQWISGDWNAICDICGFQFKASELRENWKHQRVCKDDFETRHPQEFVRARPESPQVPWSRSDDTQGVVDETDLVSEPLGTPSLTLTASADAQVYHCTLNSSGGWGTWELRLPSANNATYRGFTTAISVYLDAGETNRTLTISTVSGTIRGGVILTPGMTARYINYPATNTWQREI
jgi:hypothetical protein